MKHKVSELEGALLDAAVAQALGHPWRIDDETVVYVKGRLADQEEESAFCPSRYWDHGGPIIERERIGLIQLSLPDRPARWGANFGISWHMQALDEGSTGPRPLVAAMRAYVASRFGEEIDL